MQKAKTVLNLTIDLLANGAFNHLQDNVISGLHLLIIRLREPLNTVDENMLLCYWNHADSGNIPAALLYRCNHVLQQLGRYPIEELAMVDEMY